MRRASPCATLNDFSPLTVTTDLPDIGTISMRHINVVKDGKRNKQRVEGWHLATVSIFRKKGSITRKLSPLRTLDLAATEKRRVRQISNAISLSYSPTQSTHGVLERISACRFNI